MMSSNSMLPLARSLCVFGRAGFHDAMDAVKLRLSCCQPSRPENIQRNIITVFIDVFLLPSGICSFVAPLQRCGPSKPVEMVRNAVSLTSNCRPRSFPGLNVRCVRVPGSRFAEQGPRPRLRPAAAPWPSAGSWTSTGF